MKSLFLINLIISILFFSCSSNNNNSGEETDEVVIDSTETSNENKLDMSSAENFLNSFIEARKTTITENNEETKINISGEIVFKHNFITIFQINETVGNNQSVYSIAKGVLEISNFQIGDKFDDILDLLNLQNTNYSLFRGSFEKTFDFNEDGVPELLLKNMDEYRISVSGTQTLWYIANNTELKQSKLMANTEAEIGICDGPIGFVENMLIDENKKQVRIERTEGKTNGGNEDCSNYTKETSEKTYYWDKDLAEFAELNSPYNLKNILESFNNNEEIPQKYYSIFNIKDEYEDVRAEEESDPVKHRILFKPKKIDDFYILAISEFSNKSKFFPPNTKSTFLFFCINKDNIVSKISFDIHDGLLEEFAFLNDSLIKVSVDWQEKNELGDDIGVLETDAHFITIKDNGILNRIPLSSSKYSYKYEILAKHGYKFEEGSAYLKYYSKFDWYKPLYDNVDSLLTNTDKEILKYFEKLSKQHEQPRPGEGTSDENFDEEGC